MANSQQLDNRKERLFHIEIEIPDLLQGERTTFYKGWASETQMVNEIKKTLPKLPDNKYPIELWLDENKQISLFRKDILEKNLSEHILERVEKLKELELAEYAATAMGVDHGYYYVSPTNIKIYNVEGTPSLSEENFIKTINFLREDYHKRWADKWANELSTPTELSKGMTINQIDETQATHYILYEKALKKNNKKYRQNNTIKKSAIKNGVQLNKPFSKGKNRNRGMRM